jgi:hypothetical protein
MERLEVEDWIAHHPQSVHADPNALLDRGEHVVRGRAHLDAWVHAIEIAQKSLRGFRGAHGYPASDSFVAREVCHEIARELKHHEPPPVDPSQSISRSLLDALDPDAQRMFLGWLNDLAEREEHSTWRKIVRFTNHRANALILKAHLSDRYDWDLDHRYSLVAARVLKMLIADFEVHVKEEIESLDEMPGTH